MNSNFYKIEKEIYIDEIFKKNPNKLIVLLFSFEDPNNINILNDTYTIKKYIKNNLNNDSETIYLYINLQKYIIKENKFSKYITKESLPYISFYFNFNLVARILNSEQDVFINTLSKLKEHLKSTKDNNTELKTEIKTEIKTELKDTEQQHLTEQIRQQRKLEEIEKLKQQYLINELTKLKKAKEIEEQK